MRAVSETVCDLLREALGVWKAQFDGDDDFDVAVPATDLLDWFADWRSRLKRAAPGSMG